MHTLWQDLTYSLRTLRQAPGFTLAVVLTLALGIGANSALFSLVNAALLRPLPYPESERVVSIASTHRGDDMQVADEPSIALWRERTRTLEALAAYQPSGANFSGGGEPERLAGASVTPEFFRVLGVHPGHGRGFLEEEGREGGERVVILGDALWRRSFNANPAILGRVVQLDGQPRTVVGVMPPGFDFPSRAEFWLPFHLPHFAAEGNSFFYDFAIGRLRAGIAPEVAQAELVELRRTAGEAFPASLQAPEVGARVISLRERQHGDLRPALLVLLAGVGCVLLIACANVANLLLARATSRRREFAVRAALGASRGRLVLQLLTEGLILSLAGGLLGLLIPLYALDLFVALGPAELARVPGIAVDRIVLGFTLAASLLTGLLFGLAPALSAARTNLQETLKAGLPGAAGGRSRTRQVLVAAQLALALVLLIGAGLFARSFLSYRGVDPGFSAEGVLTAKVSLPHTRYPDDDARRAFHQAVLEGMHALPGVEAATVTGVFPLGGFNMTTRFTPPAADSTASRWIATSRVGVGYFATFGISLLAGRDFDDRDQPGAPPVVILSESMAHLAFPDHATVAEVVGEVWEWRGTTYTVAGVVGEVRQRAGVVQGYPVFFTPIAQAGSSPTAVLALRTRLDPRTLAPALGQVVRAVDPEQPIYGVRTMEQELAREIAPRRFSATLLGSFAALALLLAGTGLYALIAYLVAQRTRELGIRVALGAGRGAVLRLVLREGVVLVLAGVALGLAGAFALTRVVASLLFGVTTTDPATFVVVPLALAAVALLASWVPARRAAGVDPMVALRAE
jgi:putative ABC transport system permease protein